MTINSVTRAEWGAKPPSSPLLHMRTPTPRIYIHHSASSAQGADAVRAFQAFHMRPKTASPPGKGMRDIAYNFLIGSDGSVYEGRGWGMAHGGNTGTDNSTSHSICFMGNFEHERPTFAALEACDELLKRGEIRGSWLLTDIRGHRDEEVGTSTACPGKYLYACIPGIAKHAQDDTPAPTPIPQPEENTDMILYKGPGAAHFFLHNGKSVPINEASDLATFRDADIKTLVLDDDTYKAFRDAYPVAASVQRAIDATK